MTAAEQRVPTALDPEQEIRARALEIAMRMPNDVQRWLLVNVGGFEDPGVFSAIMPGNVYDTAKIVAAYIRDGSRP